MQQHHVICFVLLHNKAAVFGGSQEPFRRFSCGLQKLSGAALIALLKCIALIGLQAFYKMHKEMFSAGCYVLYSLKNRKQNEHVFMHVY